MLVMNVENHPRCPYCRDAVRPQDAKRACETCMAWQHRACWEEHPRCSSCQAEDRSGSHCAAPGCWKPVGDVVTERSPRPAETSTVDMRRLCLEHAVEAARQQRQRLRLLLGLVLVLALGGGGLGLALVLNSSYASDLGEVAGLLFVLGLWGVAPLAYQHNVWADVLSELAARSRGETQPAPQARPSQGPSVTPKRAA
jgi:hypothetical protein